MSRKNSRSIAPGLMSPLNDETQKQEPSTSVTEPAPVEGGCPVKSQPPCRSDMVGVSRFSRPISDDARVELADDEERVAGTDDPDRLRSR